MAKSKIQQAVQLKKMCNTSFSELLTLSAIIMGIIFITVIGLAIMLGFNPPISLVYIALCVWAVFLGIKALESVKSKNEYCDLIANFSKEEIKELEGELEDSEARLKRIIAEADEFYKTNKESFDKKDESTIEEHKQYIENLTKTGFTSITYEDNETKIFEIKDVVKKNIAEFNSTKILPTHQLYSPGVCSPTYQKGFRYTVRTPIYIDSTHNPETARTILELWAGFYIANKTQKKQ